MLVGSGVLFSRLIGLIRDRVFAHYFGNTDPADAFKAALKIPNFLQNLFGEGALSSSFIPVYARLLAEGKEEEARKVARVIGSLLALIISLLVLAGVLTTPFFIDVIAPGFEGIKREYTIRMVKIMFPGVGVLVLSAWCLGILNSHRRFFLPYAAPVLWNFAMIVVLIGFGGKMQSYPLAEILAWGSVAGSVLQFGVQLPTVMKLAERFRFQIDVVSPHVKTIIRNFIPGVGGRGVNQVSGYVDSIFASLLPTGAMAALAYTQTIYILPVSLFGMSISNAELPEMASQLGSEDAVASVLRQRLTGAMQRVAFFIIPSMAVFLALGDSVVALLYQTGKFVRGDVNYVWSTLAGYTVGLIAATLGRLYTSAFWAMRDTRTPFRYACLRVALAAGLGWILAFPVRRWIGLSPNMGIIGLTVAAGLAAWVEFSLLRFSMNRRIGRTGIPPLYAGKILGLSFAATVPAFAIKYWTLGLPPLISGSVVLLVFGVIYFAGAAAAQIPEATQLLQVVTSRFRRAS